MSHDENHSAIPSLASRIRGSLYGVAVTDALGGPVEFKKRGKFPPVTGYQYNENFDLPPGTWTDDTSLTLCLALSLLPPLNPTGDFIPQLAIRNYVKWFEHGYMSATGSCFDIGIGTRSALSFWSQYFRALDSSFTAVPQTDDKAHEPGQQEIDALLCQKASCGNGSLMRVSPVGLVWWDDLLYAQQAAAESSRPTHPYPTCVEACVVYTTLLVSIMKGSHKAELAAELVAWPWEDEMLKARFTPYQNLEDWVAKEEREIKSSGNVVDTLEAALWSFFRTETFQGGALTVVNLGHDADTVGAVYGGLAGGYYGAEGIPKEWLNELAANETVEQVVESIVKLTESKEKRIAQEVGDTVVDMAR